MKNRFVALCRQEEQGEGTELRVAAESFAGVKILLVEDNTVRLQKGDMAMKSSP